MLLKIIVRILNLGGVDMGGGMVGRNTNPCGGITPCWTLCSSTPAGIHVTLLLHHFSPPVSMRNSLHVQCRLHGLNTAVHACTLYIQVYVIDDHVLYSCTPVCTLELLELCTFAITCSVRVCSKLIVSTFLWNSILILSLSQAPLVSIK